MQTKFTGKLRHNVSEFVYVIRQNSMILVLSDYVFEF